MSPSKMRFVARFALVGVLAGCVSICILSVDAQEAAKPESKETKLKTLLEERIALTQKALQLARAQYRAAKCTIGELIDSTRLAQEAALELCNTDLERQKVHELYLTVARENEAVATARFEAGAARGESEWLLARTERLRVEIVLERTKTKRDAPPQPGDAGIKALTLQGKIQAFESVRLVARVPGFLKTLNVDIGDRVKRGQVLAVLDVPELDAQLKHDRAAVEKAVALFEGAKVRLEGAILESERAKREALALPNEKVAKEIIFSGENKIKQAKADLIASEADIETAKATFDKSRIQLEFANFTAPFDGVVTQRGFHVGDFIGSAADSRDRAPLLTVERTDVMRVVVLVPERHVLLVKPGKAAEIDVDALPGKKSAAKVARLANAVDPKNGLMRVELDLANPTGQILSGMNCTVSILLEK